jgi:ABC-2 type transport system permease protein
MSILHQFYKYARFSWALFLANLRIEFLLLVLLPRGFFQALFFILLAQAAGGYELARFALIGNLVHVSAHSALIWMNAVIEAEKWNGTLIFRLTTPGNWLISMLGLSVANYTTVFFVGFINYLILITFFAPDITLLDFLRALPLIIMVVVSVGTAGWLIGSLAFTTRWAEWFANLVAYSMMIICGINFPTSALPGGVQAFSRYIPMTNGLLAVRAVIDGASYIDALPLIGRELIIGLIFGCAAWLVFYYRLIALRKSGNFEMV